MQVIINKINCLELQLSNKVDSWIKSFCKEAQLFEKANNWVEFWREYKEVPLLTLLATGIARNDPQSEISILREYPVSIKGGGYGYSDLFLNYYKLPVHFYLEAKYYIGTWETGFIDWSPENHRKYFDNVKKQLHDYVVSEKDKLVESYSCILLFHFVAFNDEKEFKNYIEKAKHYQLVNDQFYSLIIADDPKNADYNKHFGILELIGFIEEIKD